MKQFGECTKRITSSSNWSWREKGRRGERRGEEGRGGEVKGRGRGTYR